MALDKLDKSGTDGVCEELARRGVGVPSAQQLLSMTEPDPNNDLTLASLRSCLSQADAQSAIDDLVGMFSNKQVPAVGFSMGLGRILILMEDLAISPATGHTARMMACILPNTSLKSALKIVSSLRAAGIVGDVYPEHRLSTLERDALDLDISQGVNLELVVVDNGKEASAYNLVHHIDEASEMVI